jgi:hypothetical protein
MVENPFIHVRSPKFPILPGEDEELVNEGMYGKAFAQYLQARLIERGYKVPSICCEDWGWWVGIKGQPFELGLMVLAVRKFDGSLDCCVTLSAEPVRAWSWTRFRFIDRAPRVNALNAELRQIVESDPAIQVLGYTDGFPFE